VDSAWIRVGDDSGDMVGREKMGEVVFYIYSILMIKKLKIDNYWKFQVLESEYYYNKDSLTSRNHLIVDFDFEIIENQDLNIQVFCWNNWSWKSTVLKFIYDYIAWDSTFSRILDSWSILDCNNNVVSSEKFRVHEAKNIYWYENLLSKSMIWKGSHSFTNYNENHYIRDSPYISDDNTLREIDKFIKSMWYEPLLHIWFNRESIENQLNSWKYNWDKLSISFTIEELPNNIKQEFDTKINKCNNFPEIIDILRHEDFKNIKSKFDTTIPKIPLYKDLFNKNHDDIDHEEINDNNSYYWILLYLFSTLEFRVAKTWPWITSIWWFNKIFQKIKWRIAHWIKYFWWSERQDQFEKLLTTLQDIQKTNKEPIFYFQYLFNRHNKALPRKKLSEWERNMLHYFYNIFMQIHKWKCNIILIDEPEKSLHPRWEQEFIWLLKQVVKWKLNHINTWINRWDDWYTSVQIFIATHSTFIPTDVESKNIHKLYTKPVSLLHSNKLWYKDDLTYYRENNLLYSSDSYQKSLIGDTRVNIEKIIYKLNKRLDEEFPSSYWASQSEIDAYLFDLDTVSGAESSKLLEELVAWVETWKRKHIRSSSKHPWFQNINSKIELIDKINTTFEKSNNIAAKYLLYKLNI
jgi:ABC-type branched-subunit amino acid transport system ATPase component